MNYFYFTIFALLVGSVACQNTTTNDTKDGRIIGGYFTDISSFPYQLQLTTNQKFCSASIISSTYALSTAHCVYGAQYINLRAGSSYWGVGGYLHYAILYKVPIQYTPGSLDYDVSLIEVSQRFLIGYPGVSVVRLPYYESAPGNTLLLAGWGSYSYFKGPQSYQLKFLPETTITLNQCYGYYGGSLTSRMMCALPIPGTGACTGDSGGALVNYGTKEQFGIMLANDRCSTTRPDVYTSIAAVRYFILYNAYV